ncbi:MAG: hypothetical protein ACRDPD_09885, partial [Streptosporangiaceae bacterium]
MNNMYGTPGGPGPEGLLDAGLADAGLADAGLAGRGGGPDPQYRPAPDRKKRVLRWGTGITLVGFLAGGGITLAVTGGSNPAAVSPAAVSSAVSGTSQAEGTTLNSELNTASSTAAAVSLPRIRRALARLRALGGVDGEFTFHNSTGYHTLAFERGTIQSVSGGQVVVRAPDGTTWT